VDHCLGRGWNAGGPVVVGRGLDALQGGPVEQFAGGIADVRLFDRALVAHDLVGQRASEDGSASVDEPGLIAPIQVGRWDFNDAMFCSGAEEDPCTTGDAAGWNRGLTVSPGTEVGDGVRDLTLLLDDAHFDAGRPEATREFGFTAQHRT
jgi:hypothetical protein